MIWYLIVPFIVYFTFSNLIRGNWLLMQGQSRMNFLEWCFTIFVGCFLSLLISSVPIGLSCLIGSIPKTIGVANIPSPLITLHLKDGIEGRFFLGSGYVGDAQYYFWYRKNADGSISGGKTRRNPGVRIYEDESQPRIVTFHTEYSNSIWNKLLWIVGTDMRDDEDWCPEFYIPKGSIKEGFSL